MGAGEQVEGVGQGLVGQGDRAIEGHVGEDGICAVDGKPASQHIGSVGNSSGEGDCSGGVSKFEAERWHRGETDEVDEAHGRGWRLGGKG